MSNSDVITVEQGRVPAPPGQPGQRQGVVDQQPGGLRGAFERDAGRTSEVNRGKGPASTPLLGQAVSWRQNAIYVASIAAATEIGLGQPAHGGTSFRRVSIRVRTTHAPNAASYWTFTTQWRDEDGTAYPVETFSTATTSIRANQLIVLYHNEPGIRVEKNHEVSVLMAKTGSPADLSAVMLYSDWYVGV